MNLVARRFGHMVGLKNGFGTPPPQNKNRRNGHLDAISRVCWKMVMQFSNWVWLGLLKAKLVSVLGWS